MRGLRWRMVFASMLQNGLFFRNRLLPFLELASPSGKIAFLFFSLSYMFGFGTKFSGRQGYHSFKQAFLTRPQIPDNTQQAFPLAPVHVLSRQMALDVKCRFGSRKVWPDWHASDLRANAIRRTAERFRRAAKRSCRRRAALQLPPPVDCDLSFLLTNVFSVPAPCFSERRADLRHRQAN